MDIDEQIERVMDSLHVFINRTIDEWDLHPLTMLGILQRGILEFNQNIYDIRDNDDENTTL